jgi:hypothetical protein
MRFLYRIRRKTLKESETIEEEAVEVEHVRKAFGSAVLRVRTHRI